jgi:AraC-like DNA-binding protein
VDVDRAADLYTHGWTLRQISAELGLSATTVSQQLRRAGITMRRGAPAHPASTQRILELNGQGLTSSEATPPSRLAQAVAEAGRILANSTLELSRRRVRHRQDEEEGGEEEEMLTEEAKDALGEYLDTVTRDEARAALDDHEAGTVIVDQDVDGKTVLFGSGRLAKVADADDIYVVRIGDVRDALWFILPENVTFKRYFGGLGFTLGGVEWTIVLWQDVLHLTPSGDIAPGLGDVQLNVEEHEE